METNELRIGNYISTGVGEETVIELYQHKLLVGSTLSGSSVRYFEIDPIPLTEDWLVKFGFDKSIGFIMFIGEKFKGSSFEVSHNDLDRWYAFFRNFNKGEADDFVLLRNNLQYVHQLQNLYHALTGEELELKE
jgi:hypothetical protein